mmetsp:Transcript_70990/g.217589  ORF Transcript_70990/g.217589 Transcript_70990/m.217589 type:complete len:305 (-) Transcript_70990:361-1275(-)
MWPRWSWHMCSLARIWARTWPGCARCSRNLCAPASAPPTPSSPTVRGGGRTSAAAPRGKRRRPPARWRRDATRGTGGTARPRIITARGIPTARLRGESARSGSGGTRATRAPPLAAAAASGSGTSPGNLDFWACPPPAQRPAARPSPCWTWRSPTPGWSGACSPPKATAAHLRGDTGARRWGRLPPLAEALWQRRPIGRGHCQGTRPRVSAAACGAARKQRCWRPTPTALAIFFGTSSSVMPMGCCTPIWAATVKCWATGCRPGVPLPAAPQMAGFLAAYYPRPSASPAAKKQRSPTERRPRPR